MIRHATRADVDELARLEAASFPVAEAASRESIAARVAAFAECFWLVEDDETGELLAFVNGMVAEGPDLVDEMYDDPALHDPAADWLMVFSVVSNPAHRGEGHATAALARALEDARARGQRGAVLTCKERLLGFYERLGFRSEGVSGSEHGGAVWYQMRATF